MQQGRTSDAEVSIKRLYGKERVAEVMRDLDAARQGSSEPEAGWFDLFSRRYSKGISFLIQMFILTSLKFSRDGCDSSIMFYGKTKPLNTFDPVNLECGGP